MDTPFGDGDDVVFDFTFDAEDISFIADGCIPSMALLRFEVVFVDDRTGAKGDVEDLEDTFSTIFEDLSVVPVLLPEETVLFDDKEDVAVIFFVWVCESILVDPDVDWFWIDRLLELWFGDTRSLAEELWGVDMLTRSPTCEFLETEEVELVMVLGLSLADELLDGDMLTRSPTI